MAKSMKKHKNLVKILNYLKNTPNSLDLGVRFCPLSCIIIDEITFIDNVCYNE